jgi:hypothetical protein
MSNGVTNVMQQSDLLGPFDYAHNRKLEREMEGNPELLPNSGVIII